MLDVAIALVPPWPTDPDGESWHAICARAITAALSVTPHHQLADIDALVEVSVRLTGDSEIQGLNDQWRGKQTPTNVLSFPMVQSDALPLLTNSDDGEILLGDIVLSYETCLREALAKDVALVAHVSHLAVHGMLHLMGYDHVAEADAEIMEAAERTAMALIGFDDPYAEGGELST